MFWLLLEALAAVIVLVGIVWFTVRGATHHDDD
jgi:hypothetical protein